MLIIDIDHFKSINDHHGHPVGDEVLKFLARELHTAVREPAFFGRLGGEEFLIVLPDTPLDEARCPAADRFREQIMAIDTVALAAGPPAHHRQHRRHRVEAGNLHVERHADARGRRALRRQTRRPQLREEPTPELPMKGTPSETKIA